jgi:photosystem II stability/assembly factor-like uncharacterized protein
MSRISSLLLVASLTAAPMAVAAEVDPSLLAGLKARSIGPATMSGRITDVDVVESDPDIVWAGAGTGGVWKSVNGGLTWTPVFDDQPVHSIGSLAIFQANPDVVWVGTGEGNVRNSVSIGNGVYRTLDGGRTWQHLGLEKTERIHRVILHPTDPNTAWVAALGQLWGENGDRGVYKTTDGGKNWRKVLSVDQRTGAAELVADPRNPNKMFAAMWTFRRWPWIFKSGGAGSGLHVTYDGGETWRKVTEDDGLPKGVLGRIGLAISPSNPNIVYALVEAEKSALVRSDDGGKTWRTVNDEQRTAERPFYYADIKVDPVWPNRLYNLTARLQVSEDSGKTWNVLGRSREIHGDHHDLWINPKDPEHMIAGNDGGLGISRDRGETWQFVSTLPLAQFYHVAVDMDVPYNVYGGLQDNGSWRGPSAAWDGSGLRNASWDPVGFGDGFDTRPDPADSMTGYSMSQGGELIRWNLRTREFNVIRPPDPKAGEGERLRFNWNAGIAIDPFEPGTIYYGSQYVHKSTDRGASWTTISPDLTTDNADKQRQFESGGLTPDVTAAENHTTIVAIAPSPLERNVLWVGTDDGRLHVTRDGGKTWSSVEKNVRGVPADTWIPHVLPSKHDPAGAFVVFDNHRRSDFVPYVYRTDDWGKTWKSLATKDIRGYALSVEQDPVDRDLLFLGTEFGLYASFDGGAHWTPWKHGLPTASVMDMVIHPRDHDLVLGTHGRSLYVIDDISPLREVTAETLAKPLHVYSGGPALLHRRRFGGGVRGGGAGEYQGENRAFGAFINYSLNLPGLPLPDAERERERKEAERAAANVKQASEQRPGEPLKEDAPPPGTMTGRPSGAPEGPDAGRDGGRGEPKAEIRITDASGRLIRKMEGPANLGLNRAVWDFGREPFRRPATDNRGRQRQGADSGPTVPPGTYTVTVKFRGQEAKGTLQVVPDPSLKIADGDWQAREEVVTRVGNLQNAVVDAITRIETTEGDVKTVLAKLDARKKEREQTAPAATGGTSEAADPDKPLADAARQLQKRLAEVKRKLHVPSDAKGIVEDQTALRHVEYASRAAESSWGRPTPTVMAHIEKGEASAKEALAEFNKLFAEDVAAFRQKVSQAGIGLLAEQPPIAVR